MKHHSMKHHDVKKTALGLLFVSPWLLGFAVFVIYPLVSNIHLSLHDASGFGGLEFLGVANYRALVRDDLFWRSLYNTLYYTLLAVPLGAVMALVLGLVMNVRLKEMPIYRALLVLPSVLPIFALSFVFVWLLNPRYGLVNRLFLAVGLPSINWLGDPFWAKFSIVLLAQMGAAQFGLIVLAALQDIPRDLFDAAKLDGATGLRRFWHITLPLLRPVLLYDVVIGVGLGLQVFTPAYIMTQGGPNNATLFYALYLYRNAFRYSDMGYAAAMSSILFALNLIVALGLFRLFDKRASYQVGV
jgi:multiple sugar transport system permease protein